MVNEVVKTDLQLIFSIKKYIPTISDKIQFTVIQTLPVAIKECGIICLEMK